MTEEELLKHSFLLTHGTKYGEIAPVGDYVAPSGLTASVDQCCPSAVTWRNNLFPSYAMVSSNLGVGSGKTAIDTVHWAVNGAAPNNLNAQWEQCMTLLTRL